MVVPWLFLGFFTRSPWNVGVFDILFRLSRRKYYNIFAIEEVWYLGKYLGWVAVNINFKEMLNLCWVKGRVGLFALLVLCWQIAHFSLRIRIVNFCDRESCGFKARALQVSILTKENCFEEISLEVATSGRFGWKERKC